MESSSNWNSVVCYVNPRDFRAKIDFIVLIQSFWMDVAKNHRVQIFTPH